MAMEPLYPKDGGDSDDALHRDMLAPQMVNEMSGQLLSMCWRLLPRDRRTLENLEQYVQRVVDRAFQNLKDDYEILGRSSNDDT